MTIDALEGIVTIPILFYELSLNHSPTSRRISDGPKRGFLAVEKKI
jgi:hypothetical protein